MNLRKKLALMLATLKKKRPYYCEVEYLESTGTQWIDTGYNINTSTDEVTAYFQLITTEKYSWLMGEHDTGARLGIGSGDGTNLRNIAYGVSTYKVNDTEVYNSQHYFNANSNGVYVNGTLVHAFESFSSTSTIYLFNLNISGGGNGASGRIWRYTHKRNGVLIRDFIPVLDWNYTPCMYDKVSGQLFYNQGTGTFSYGREIHYVDYIESTGTQYIDTGVTLTNNHSVEVDYQLTSASQNRKGIFGGLVASGSRFGALLSPSNNYLEFGYGSTNVWYQTGLPDTQRHIMKQQKNLLYFDGVLIYTFGTATFTQSFTAPLGNFNYTNYNPASAKYYSSKWWNNDTLVRDYIPAIDENGVGFMFDKVTHTIFDNAGTGAFKYPAREVEYLEGTGTQYINVGIKGNLNTKIEAKVYSAKTSLDSGYCIAGDLTTSTKAITMPFNFVSDALYSRFGDKYITTGIQQQDGTYTFAVDKAGYYVDGTKIVNFNTTTSFTTDGNIMLFGFTGLGRNYLVGKMYYCQMWNDTTQIRDFIPSYKDGQAGMLDKQNNVFYSNAGTGNFVAGRILEKEYE